jgi:Ran GTPase-activating protein (RanGAP) involved in mRNA processing and transport
MDLSCNIIGDAGVMQLARELPKCVSVKVLNLASNGIGHGGAFSVARILHKCPHLGILDLNNNRLGDAGAFFLTFGLKQPCTSLHRLDLSMNNISTHRQKMLTQDVLSQYPNLPMDKLILRRPTS